MILKTDISFIYRYTYNTFLIIKTLMYYVLLKLATHMHVVHMYTCTVKLMHVDIYTAFFFYQLEPSFYPLIKL